MSSQTVTSSGPSADGIIRINSCPACIPCEGSASSSTSAMQIDVPRNRCGCNVAVSEGTQSSSMAPQPHRQPQTGPTNVGELVAKAKKAAASLWMILHAQNCRAVNDNCPHRGCSETKRLLIHVKTCPAGPNFPCPTQCKGCKETRKLLAHYRRCKDMRMKQVGLGRRSGLQPDQSCLVCSLMARYAKSMMDRSSHGKSNNNALAASLLSYSRDKDRNKFNVERGLAYSNSNFNHQANTLSPVDEGNKFNVERGLACSNSNFNHQANALSPVDAGPSRCFKRTSSGILMPPPPPRSGSAPTSSSTMNRKCTANESFDTYPSLLGKSVDSHVSVPFPILRHPSTIREVVTGDQVLVVPGLTPTPTGSPRRQRADSYAFDERRQRAESYAFDERPRVKFAPNVITSEQYYCNDQEEGQSSSGSMVQNNDATRPRSASCSNMGLNNGHPTPSSAHGCETIAEEGVEHEEPFFQMD